MPKHYRYNVETMLEHFVFGHHGMKISLTECSVQQIEALRLKVTKGPNLGEADARENPGLPLNGEEISMHLHRHQI